MRQFLIIKVISVFAVFFGLICSCQKTPELTLTGPNSISLNAEGGSASITFITNRDWNISSPANWITFIPMSGTGSSSETTVTIQCSANKDYYLDRKASVTIKLNDNELKQEINVNQGKMPQPNTVDLGVVVTRNDGTKYKLLWGDRNIGAFVPDDPGDLFAWGEVSSRYFPDALGPLWIAYKLGTKDESHWAYTKYCYSTNSSSWGGSGTPDDKTTLELEDDAAHVLLGGKWRMPTYSEWEALYKQTEFSDSDTPNYKTKGRIVVSRSGANKHIFLPFVIRDLDSWVYWSSSLEDGDSSRAKAIGMKSSWWITGIGVYRHNGLPIRPVMESALN